MKVPMVVAVSQRIDVLADRGERRDALDQRLVALLVTCGLVPVPVPNGMADPTHSPSQGDTVLDAWLARVQPGALVLSGGNDVGQCADRDNTERALLAHARRHRWPVLGICRGMQMMASWAGGRLVQVEGHVRTRHRLQLTDPSQWGTWPAEVSSYHDWSLAACPDGYTVAARSEEGGIEAIRHSSLAWEGWMWHPERESTFASEDVQRIQELFRETTAR